MSNETICNVIMMLGLLIAFFGIGLAFFHFVSMIVPFIGVALMCFGYFESF